MELYCNLCGHIIERKDDWWTVAVMPNSTMIVCEKCVNDKASGIRACPVCNNLVHRSLIEEFGRCPYCNFEECPPDKVWLPGAEQL